MLYRVTVKKYEPVIAVYDVCACDSQEAKEKAMMRADRDECFKRPPAEAKARVVSVVSADFMDQD